MRHMTMNWTGVKVTAVVCWAGNLYSPIGESAAPGPMVRTSRIGIPL